MEQHPLAEAEHASLLLQHVEVAVEQLQPRPWVQSASSQPTASTKADKLQQMALRAETDKEGPRSQEQLELRFKLGGHIKAEVVVETEHSTLPWLVVIALYTTLHYSTLQTQKIPDSSYVHC